MFIEERHQKFQILLKRMVRSPLLKSQVNTVYQMSLHAGICDCSNRKAFARELTAVPFR